MSKNIVLLGAGGAAARNFKRAVDSGYAAIGESVNWHLVDADPYALELCRLDERKGNQYYHYAVTHFKSVLNSIEFDFVHSQPEQGVEFLIKNYDDFKGKVFKNKIKEYLMYRDKLKCQTTWAACMDIPFWVKKASDLSKKEFNSKIKNQPGGRFWVRARVGAGSRAALPVSSYKQLQGWIDFWKSKDPDVELLVSDMLPGDEYAVQMLWIDGKLIAAQARRRVDYLFGKQMPSGQSSTPSVSEVVVDPHVYTTAIFAVKFLSHTPNGIYGVDMKTTHCGRIMPTEINYGRFYTTSHQWINAKPKPLNIPFDYTQYVIDGKLPEQRINSLPEGLIHVRGLDSPGRLI